MIFFSFGLPGSFADWCDAVTAQLAQCALGSAEIAALNTPEELAIAVIGTVKPHLIATSREPANTLLNAISLVKRRFIVALQDPRHSLRDLVIGQGIDFAEAVRLVARSCAAITRCIQEPDALVLRPDQPVNNCITTIEGIRRHLGLEMSEAEHIETVDALLNLFPEAAVSENYWWDQLDEGRRVLANGALEAYIFHFSAGGDLGGISWNRGLFHIFEDPPGHPPPPATRPLDITGRPRILLFGPFISLPPGNWSAKVVLGFSKEAREMSYIVEVFAGIQLTHIRIQPGSESLLEANLHFTRHSPDTQWL
jgi:hypothetical protein